MTTSLDTRLVPRVFALIERVGVTATFRAYQGIGVDTDGSIVNVGTATDYVVKVSPPQNQMIEVSLNEEILETTALEIYLATGSGTADDIGFVPELSTEDKSMTCLLGGINYSIIKIEPLSSGDHVAAYKVYLRKR